MVLIEQNSVPGLANRMLYPFSSLTVLNFRYSKRWFRRGVVIGNPVDAAIGNADRKEALRFFGLDPAKPVVLIIGGSQGAKGLNEVVLKALRNLSDCGVLWAAGRKHFAEVKSRLTGDTKRVVLVDFIERMDLAWAAADVAVCRSGAATVSEMKKVGVPAVLVPYPHATDDHQYHNAKELEENGLAKVIREEDLTPDGLAGAVRSIFAEYGRYKDCFAKTGESGVNDRIVTAIMKLAPM